MVDKRVAPCILAVTGLTVVALLTTFVFGNQDQVRAVGSLTVAYNVLAALWCWRQIRLEAEGLSNRVERSGVRRISRRPPPAEPTSSILMDVVREVGQRSLETERLTRELDDATTEITHLSSAWVNELRQRQALEQELEIVRRQALLVAALTVPGPGSERCPVSRLDEVQRLMAEMQLELTSSGIRRAG
ncbi:MAG: hypothetical protein PHT12_00600 [Patescibacteria group bacterium]|nr:hypothetical protein [Patescibacteria group bacterium]